MSSDVIEKRVRHAALLDNGGLASHMQMLFANQPSWLGGRGRGEGDGESLSQDMADMAGEMLADPSESKLCPKQAVIRDKLDELLAKLAAQTIIVNETDRKLYLEYIKARGDYYDEGAKWGLAKSKEHRDDQKKDFDRIKFMLWEDEMKKAEEKFIEVQNRTIAHEKELSEEQKLIRQLIKMIDHMHAIESSDGRQELKGKVHALIMLANKQTHARKGGRGKRALSKAAGLVSMDVADIEAHKGEMGELVSKLSKLSRFLQDTQMSQLAGGKVQSLKSFEESNEVRKILEEMLEEVGKQVDFTRIHAQKHGYMNTTYTKHEYMNTKTQDTHTHKTTFTHEKINTNTHMKLQMQNTHEITNAHTHENTLKDLTHSALQASQHLLSCHSQADEFVRLRAYIYQFKKFARWLMEQPSCFAQLELLKEEIENSRRDADEARKKMEFWRKSMVDNRDDAEDEGKAKDEAAPIRLKDEGDYISAKERYEDNHRLYVKILNPYERQIYIIMMVKKKIKEHCEKIGA